MLEFFRKNVGGLLGFLIIGALVLAFVLTFGAQNQGWGKGAESASAITVDGEEISNSVLRYAINLSASSNVQQDSAEYAALRQTVAQGLIERQVLLNLAEEAGVSASTDEATDNILRGDFFITRPLSQIMEQLSFQIQFGRMPAGMLTAVVVKEGHRAMLGKFKGADGRFDVEMFNKVIRYQLQTKEEDFVEQQRLELIALRMRQLLLTGVSVSDAELRDVYNRENDTVTLSFLRIAPEALAARYQPTPEELAIWTAANQEAISKNYETNKFKYTNVEKMARARHILIKVDKDAPAEEKTAARARIDGLLAEVKKPGADFAAIARLNSQDPGSAVKGGDLGFNPRGVMVPAFDDVMFALAPGAISTVVETEFGYHILQLIALREGNVALADATPEIAEKLIAEAYGKTQAEKAANDYLMTLKSGTAIDSLIPVGSEDNYPAHLQLKVQKSGAFSPSSASIPGIGESKELISAAFALSQDKPVVDKVFNINGTWFVAALAERVKPSDEDFKAKKSAIEDRVLTMKQATWLGDRIRGIVDELMKAGKVKSDVALQLGSAKGPEAPRATPSGKSGDSSAAPEKESGVE